MRIILTALLILGTQAFAQTKSYPALQVYPQPLMQGGNINIRYQPQKGNLNAKDRAVVAILVAFHEGDPVAYDTIMQPGKKGVLEAGFRLSDSVDAVVIRIVQGDQEDNNSGSGYFFTVLDKQGKEQHGTSGSLAMIYSGHFATGIKNTNTTLSEKYLRTYLQQVNINKKGLANYISLLTRIKDTAGICSTLNKYAQYRINSENDYFFLASMAERFCEDSALTARLQTAKQQQFPEGSWRFQAWYDSLMNTRLLNERIVWLKAFLMAYGKEDKPAMEYASRTMGDWTLSLAAREKNVSRFAEVESLLSNAPPIAKSSMASFYNTLAWECALQDTLLADAARYSGQSISIMRHLEQTLEEKSPMVSKISYLQELGYDRINYADTYGLILFKLGQYDSAAHYALQAASGRNWKDAEMNARCINALEKTKPAGEVLTYLDKVISNDAYTASMQAQYIRVATAAGIANPADRWTARIAEAREKRLGELRKEMSSKPAPLFTLSRMDGSSVSLESLKGKVVVLDFWATWCGPCIASFPGMQQVVDRSKEQQDVAIFFVNTWESGSDKTEKVKAFFRDNPYTFDVLMDNDRKVVSSYGVEGIPTKFIIDKQGRIRFTSVGYNGSTDKTVMEMEAMIEMAKHAD